MYEKQEEEEKIVEGRGRSAKKRQAKAIEDLARNLTEMPEARFLKLPASEEIREELLACRAIKTGSARKRQIKHLAGLLRRDEEQAEELRVFTEGENAARLQEKKDFHSLEELRDRLCDAELFPAALEEAREALPLLDAPAIGRLARSVQTSGDKRAFRDIFRRLRTAWEEEENR